jgi:NTE family protein
MDRKIGVALSGGGIRATIFHLGVFKYLAEARQMESITHVSSVSGASLCVALIYAHHNNRWPSSGDFLDKTLPAIEKTILGADIQKTALLRLPLSPAYWDNKAALIAKVLRDKWHITGTLQDIGDTPVWDVNCTTFETGKNFRFNQKSMGDYEIGYVEKPAIPLADIASASAGFPILIGPYKLNAKAYTWDRQPREQTYWLWDGGVYDNLGLESLFKPEKGLTQDVTYLIVSNASCSSGYMERKTSVSAKNLKRLLDITMDQVAALRSRDVFADILLHNQGLFINIGNPAQKIVDKSTLDAETAKKLVAACMTPEQALRVRDYATTLATPTPDNFRLILRHGYENAMCCYTCWGNSPGA